MHPIYQSGKLRRASRYFDNINIPYVIHFTIKRPQDLDQILRTFPHVKSLDLSHGDFNDDDLAKLAQHTDIQSELQTLHLDWCHGLTGQSMLDIKKLAKLKNLSLLGTDFSSNSKNLAEDQGFLRHLGELTDLERLDLSWCSKLGDQDLNDLIAAKDNGKLPSLRCIKLVETHHNSNMSKAAIANLQSKFPDCEVVLEEDDDDTVSLTESEKVSIPDLLRGSLTPSELLDHTSSLLASARERLLDQT